ncbi:MAG: hypothetical protein J2P36_16150, partial [Ktedonobacteraceae bacterium]|nr:hypothetical protein [Ktedonobacteraceae bacterium]
QNDFAREEKMKQHILDEQKKLLSSIVDSAIRANNDRMNESLDYNNPTYLVLQDSLKLLTVLNNASVSSQDQKEIIDAMRSTGALPVDPEEG